MLKTIIFALLLFVTAGCNINSSQKDVLDESIASIVMGFDEEKYFNPNQIDSSGNKMYVPYLFCWRSDSKVILEWGKPMGLDESPQLDPHYFQILISDNGESDLKLHSSVQGDVFTLEIDSLTNGVPYYFAVKAIGKSNQFTISKKLMTIPDYPENIQPYFPTADFFAGLGSWSNEDKCIAYMGNYTWDNGSKSAHSVFMYNKITNKHELIEKSSYAPEWSPVEQKIVYSTDGVGFQSRIEVYDITNSKISKLTDGKSYDMLPTWSPDGKWIAYLSDKAGGEEQNIWKISADGGEAIQITKDFNDLEFYNRSDRSPQSVVWSKDGQYLIFARMKKTYEKYVYNIYAVPSKGGFKTSVVTSPWNDHSPTFSPDGSRIAFVSDRSGVSELWIMDLLTKELKQVTASDREVNVFNSWGKIDWSPTGEKLLFTSNGTQYPQLYTVEVD